MIKTYTVDQARKSILKREISSLNKNLKSEGITPEESVKTIVKDVKERKDAALKDWTLKFDKVEIDQFEILNVDFEKYLSSINSKLRKALEIACERIYNFHKSQPIISWMNYNLGGQIGQIIKPIETVGIYIPGGITPLFSSILMATLPAIVAGVKNIIFTSPPNKQGTLSKIIFATFGLIKKYDINMRIFRIGGAQAIAAMAFGTEQVPRVDKIVGPGNIYVNLAKKEVYGTVGIDGIYGPTEALIIADEIADPSLVASDLLAQAEHDILAVPILVTSSENLISSVKKELERQIITLKGKSIIKESIQNMGGVILTNSIEESIQISNEFAPEHLSLMIKEPMKVLDKIENAGGIFIGENSFEVLGDYIAGPSHVMPTNGTARFSSALSVYDFIKRISYVYINEETSFNLSKHAEIIAEAENLTGHANAAALRTDFNKNKKEDS
ncbi:MAG: histidinol dehydrogenase [Candidatus Odinarchaeota archaeon]